MIFLLGLFAGFIGFVIGKNLRFVKALGVAVVVGFVLASVPMGVAFAELPIGLLIGGIIGSFRS